MSIHSQISKYRVLLPYFLNTGPSFPAPSSTMASSAANGNPNDTNAISEISVLRQKHHSKVSPTSSFHAFCLSLPPSTLTSLFSSPPPRDHCLPRGCFFVLAIVATLMNPVERTIIMRLSCLGVGSGVTRRQFESWFSKGVRGWQWDKLASLQAVQVNPEHDIKSKMGEAEKVWFVRLRKEFHER